jgi:hypothetical protein
MEKYPKILEAKAIKPFLIEVIFNNNFKKYYDFKELLNYDIFIPLRDYAFFKNFQVSSGGYGIEWNEEIDLSESELWLNGKDNI